MGNKEEKPKKGAKIIPLKQPRKPVKKTTQPKVPGHMRDDS